MRQVMWISDFGFRISDSPPTGTQPTVRSFLAVPFAADVKARYRTLYEEGRSRYPRLRWVAPENLHITVRFLGDTSPEVVEPLREAVASEVAREAAFSFTIGPPGQFLGPSGVPRVLWLAIEDGPGCLEHVARGVERAVRRCGFPRERHPWRPHLTVARNSRHSPQSVAVGDWECLGRDCGLAGLSVNVENVALLESTLRAEGPLYSLVWEAPLGVSGSREDDDKKKE